MSISHKGFSDIHRENVRYIKKNIKRDSIDIYHYDSYDSYDYIKDYIYTFICNQKQIKRILKKISKNVNYSNRRALQLLDDNQEKLVRDFYDNYVVDPDITRLRLMRLKYDY